MDAIETDAVEQKRQQLIQEIQTLPASVLQEAADLIAQLHRKAKTLSTAKSSDQEVANPYQELKEFGLIGCGEGPSDLSVNYKKYLAEGWGKK
jgi:hypothetical protein